MSRLVESIRLLDGEYYNLLYHEERMTRSLHTLYGVDAKINLKAYLDQHHRPDAGLYKCRLVYDHMDHEVTYAPYEPKKIKRVKVVEDDDISYAFKFHDRQPIDRLFQRRGDCDDVLIVKKGMVTDCSFSNIVFWDGQAWFTPSTPLLEGTMRQKLIDEKKITSREIRAEDIRSFQKFKIINAMLEFSSAEIEVSEIVF